MADNTIKIGGELESMATGKIVAAASAVLDKLKNKTQELINQENTSGIEINAEDIANLNAVVASLQQLIDAATITGGTVANAAEVFVAAIAGLNANNVQAALEMLNDRTDCISKSATSTEDDEILITTNGGTLVGKIDTNGADFVNLKKNGQNVATENQIPSVPTLDTSIGDNPSNSHTPSSKAVKDYVDAHSGGDFPIGKETTLSGDEELEFANDAGSQSYAKVGSYGVKSKAYLDMQGNNVIPTKDTAIEDTPSQTNVPTSKAVVDYVEAHGGGGIGDLPISKETTQSENKEQIWVDDAETQEYAKIGSYGIKAKKLLNLDGTPYTMYAENIPDYILDVITYKPLGKLSKSYLVVIADDGNSSAATYTIPNIVQALGIPVTFALATTSAIVTNTTYRASLQDAIANYGCGVCQHGFAYWGGDKGERTGTMLTEQELVAFFESEAETWETLGVECLGGACPDHLYDYKTLAVAYHYLKVLCNGASYQVYPNAANCERSNRLELQRLGLHSFSETYIKSAIDYAYEHNGLVIVFSHDAQLQSNYNNCRSRLEAIVPYAQTKGLEVCSLNKVIKDNFLNAYM